MNVEDDVQRLRGGGVTCEVVPGCLGLGGCMCVPTYAQAWALYVRLMKNAKSAGHQKMRYFGKNTFMVSPIVLATLSLVISQL